MMLLLSLMLYNKPQSHCIKARQIYNLQKMQMLQLGHFGRTCDMHVAVDVPFDVDS